MFKVENNIISIAFNQLFSLIDHTYTYNKIFWLPFQNMWFQFKIIRFGIDFRGPTERNKLLAESENPYTSIAVFKNKVKEKTINFSDDFLFF